MLIFLTRGPVWPSLPSSLLSPSVFSVCRVDQICLKGKEYELPKRWKQLSLREAAIKHQEEEFLAHKAAQEHE
jgi:hypothetical protein